MSNHKPIPPKHQSQNSPKTKQSLPTTIHTHNSADKNSSSHQTSLPSSSTNPPSTILANLTISTAEDVLESEDDLVPDIAVEVTPLTLIGQFWSEYVPDLPSMRNTLAFLWKPVYGVTIKAQGTRRFFFQFYHERDLKRIINGGPWTFNRKVLLLTYMAPLSNPLSDPIENIDFWIQVHDVPLGFRLERVCADVGNKMGQFIEFDPANFNDRWKPFLRIRVRLNVTKPLLEGMFIKKKGQQPS